MSPYQVFEKGKFFDRLFGELGSVFSYFNTSHVKDYASAWDEAITNGVKGAQKAASQSITTLSKETQKGVKELGDLVKEASTRLKLPGKSENYVKEYQERALPHIYATDNNYSPRENPERPAA